MTSEAEEPEDQKRPLGLLVGSVPEEFFEPLPDDELERWAARPEP